MYYVNRIELGRTLGQRLKDLKGEESVVVALKESALSACIGLATEVNAWVFPLLTERIYVPGDPRVMGLINADGQFSWNPDLSTFEIEDIQTESHAVIEDQKRQAFSTLNQKLATYSTFNKSALSGRTILLAGDVVGDRLEVAAALEYLKSVKYKRLYGVGGNVDSLAADFMHLQTDASVVLDVMTHMFDDDHYFEQKEAYSIEECRRLATNISQYWT